MPRRVSGRIFGGNLGGFRRPGILGSPKGTVRVREFLIIPLRIVLIVQNDSLHVSME